MAVLSYKTHRVVVADALLDLVNVALRARPVVATPAALRAVTTAGAAGAYQADRELRYVTSLGRVVAYRATSLAADDGATVFKPTDRGSYPGRWVLQTSSVLAEDGTEVSALSTGYLKNVLLYQGERSKAEWDQKILALRPAVALKFTGESKEQISGLRGAIAVKWLHFEIWGISFNARPSNEAQTGPRLAVDTAAGDDPGVDRIMGDLEYLLDGTTGAEIGLDGLDYLRFGEVTPAVEVAELKQREFLWTAPLDARVTVGREDPVRRQFSSGFFLAQDAAYRGAVGGEIDSDNVVVSGLGIATGMGLSRACADGSAKIAGVTVTVTGSPAHVYAASLATWRDLNPDGTFTYVESGGPDSVPGVTDGALRVSVVLTDPSGIIEDRPLASSLMDFGPDNEMLP